MSITWFKFTKNKFNKYYSVVLYNTIKIQFVIVIMQIIVIYIANKKYYF